MRTYDIAAVAQSYAAGPAAAPLARVLGGATFDVSMRFLTEDPGSALALVREKVPNI